MKKVEEYVLVSKIRIKIQIKKKTHKQRYFAYLCLICINILRSIMVFFAQKVAHFVFFYYLCARKIRDVHQLAADVDYFADTRMLRTLHSKKL